MTGAIARQGPHHGAQVSTSTGLAPADSSAAWSVASVRITGCEESADTPAAAEGAGSCRPHLPHTGRSRPDLLSSTRFFAPQLGQVTIAMPDSIPRPAPPLEPHLL